jgi:hypothetical protein
MSKHPLLKIEPETIKKEFNITKFIAQVLMGVAVGLATREIINQIDAWKERKKKKA